MKILSVTARILSTLLTVVLGVVLAFNVYTIAARAITKQLQPDVFGFSVAVVISGSMQDAIDINDMVLIHEKKDYSVGDVITFRSGDSLVTHRIVGTAQGGFVTKGDANNAADPNPVAMEAVVGKVVLVIPKIGAAIEFMRTPLGMTCLVLVGFALVEVPTIMDRIREERGRKADENDTIE